MQTKTQKTHNSKKCTKASSLALFRISATDINKAYA